MQKTSTISPVYTFKPVTSGQWNDFVTLFGPRGAMAGCWCMWWRSKRKDFEANQGERNKSAMKAYVDAGGVPGLLAYDGEKPVGWVSTGPREEYPVLQRSPVLKPVDDLPAWSVVCFFIHADYRGMGVSKFLLNAAVDYARQNGAVIIEGYPLVPKKGSVPDIYAFTGPLTIYEQAGFIKADVQRSQSRRIMRLKLGESAGS